MYDEEKKLCSYSMAGASEHVNQERVVTELTTPKESDNSLDATSKKFCDVVLGREKVLETSKTQAERSKEKLITNQIPVIEISGREKVLVASKTQDKRFEGKLTTNRIPEISNPTEVIQSEMRIPIESGEVDEERVQFANETIRRITYSQKTCSQCPICKHLSLSRKRAIEHFQDEHNEEDSSQAKFSRICYIGKLHVLNAIVFVSMTR